MALDGIRVPFDYLMIRDRTGSFLKDVVSVDFVKCTATLGSGEVIEIESQFVLGGPASAHVRFRSSGVEIRSSATAGQGTESPIIEDRRFEYFPIGQKLVCKSCQAEWTDVKPNDVDQVLTDHIGSCTGVGS
jgi:hypothetical protein